jgi:hypothetical protein
MGKGILSAKTGRSAVVFVLLATLSACATLSMKPTRELILALKEDPDVFGLDKTGRALVARGRSATPLLLQEFESAEDYYLCSLVNVLAKIPSEERDRAFIRKLEMKKEATKDFLLKSYAAAMMAALADNGCKDAVPIIREYATSPRTENELRTNAKVALNNLDCENLSPSVDVLKMDEGLKQSIRTLHA